MKKLSFVLILLSGLLFTGIASASPTVTLNGQPLTFDVPPVIDNGRTMVPLRATFEALGATVRWDANTRTIAATKGDASIQLTVGDTSAAKNGAKITLDAPPRILDGRTLVPLRFIGEALGCQVNWDDSTQTVSISDAPPGTSPGSEPANPPQPAPVAIGQWEYKTRDVPYSNNVWNIPGEPVVSFSKENSMVLVVDESGSGGDEFVYGKPIKFMLEMINTSDVGGTPESITILDYTPSVKIDSYDSSDNETVIWKQTMPTLSGTLAKPSDYYSLELIWSQRDMSGSQVPPGGYGLTLQPGVLRYKTPDGNEHTQKLTPALANCLHPLNIVKP